MSESVEIYVLATSRTKAMVLAFLDRFLPNRQQVQDDFSLPELSNEPHRVFHDFSMLLEFLECDPTSSYGIYFNNKESSEPFQAMVFFTEDSHAIFGLVVNPENAILAMSDLKGWAGALLGYVAEDCRPPETSTGFVDQCRRSASIRLVDGQILLPRRIP